MTNTRLNNRQEEVPTGGKLFTTEDTENPEDRQQFKTTSPVIVVFILEQLLGVNFLSFMQTQGDGHRLA